MRFSPCAAAACMRAFTGRALKGQENPHNGSAGGSPEEGERQIPGEDRFACMQRTKGTTGEEVLGLVEAPRVLHHPYYSVKQWTDYLIIKKRGRKFS